MNSGSSFGFNAVPSLFTSSENQAGGIFEISTTTTQIGTGKIKFSALICQDSVSKNGVQSSIQTNHQSITVMKEYEGKSQEELRFEDYQANCKFKISPTFGTSIGLFGSLMQSTSSGFDSCRLFSPSSTASKPFGGFGSPNTTTSLITSSRSPTSFGSFGTKKPSTTSALNTTTDFGQTIQPFPVLFGTSSSHLTGNSPFVSGGLFGSSTQHNQQQKPLFGGSSSSTTDATSSNFPCKSKTNHPLSKANISIFDLMNPILVKRQFKHW